MTLDYITCSIYRYNVLVLLPALWVNLRRVQFALGYVVNVWSMAGVVTRNGYLRGSPLERLSFSLVVVREKVV
jgi:hypothetical protein